mgnify:CR=1 FL=1
MKEKTRILGKVAALEDTIATLQSQFEKLGFNIVEASWLNPVPNVWSVTVHDADCRLCSSNGKGTSQKAALASALAQHLERLACNYFFVDYYMGIRKPDHTFYHYPQERWFPATESWPDGLIDDEPLQSLYNAEGTLTPKHLIDTNSGDAARGIVALPYVRISDQKTQWFPVNLINNLYVSNGMAAGNTREEARAQALSELLERHIKFHVITEALALPDLPEDVLARFPNVLESIVALRQHGYGVLVRDASLGGHYPVMSVTLLNPENGSCFASFGAHPRLEVALERALTELLQGRSLEQLGIFSEPSFDQDDVVSHENLETHFIDSSGLMPWSFFCDEADFEFHDWDFGAEPVDEYLWLCNIFAEDGHEVYIADYEHLGFYACRAIVPGLSEIYSPDNLEWDNNNTALPWRHVLLNLHNSDNEQLQELSDWLEEEGTPDQLSVASLAGIAPDADSPWEALRVGHLKLWLSLALQQTDDVPELCIWAIDLGEASGLDVRLYRCIAILAGLNTEDGYEAEHYETSLKALYPAELLRLARSLLEGSVRFPGLHDPSLDLTDMKRHRSLIAANEKLQRAMTEYQANN